MKKFLIQISVFLGIFFLIAYLILSLADGNADGHYGRFTSPQQNSLILGTSKAAQGLQPQVINSYLGREDVYNYSFTVGHSPYGPAYYKSIKKKLDPKTKNGIFILTVDPYSLSSRLENPEDVSNFRENGRFVEDIKLVNSKPNFEYLIWHYPDPFIYLLTRKLNYINDDFLHDDGWAEINISMDDGDVHERMKGKIIEYGETLPSYNFSQIRLSYLERTIKFLQQHGQVYLVRLPVSKPFLEMENAVTPDFDLKIEKLSNQNNSPFLNLTIQEPNYDFTDGNHLYKTSGALVSQKIAVWIQIQQRN